MESDVHERADIPWFPDDEYEIARVGAAKGTSHPLNVPAVGKLARETRIGMVTPKMKSAIANIVDSFMIRGLSLAESELGIGQGVWFYIRKRREQAEVHVRETRLQQQRD